MSQEPMPTRTRLATFVVALGATAIGFVAPAGSSDTPDGAAPPPSAGSR
ncbi:MAG: hypothetical protein H0U77_02770 [Nocardioidaceae bacterium]|nr:hypothetical protein [Nocardioidaceae bacterium]